MSDLTTISDVADLLHSGQISVTELVSSRLARVKELAPTLNCYITLAEEKPHSATTLFGAAEAVREKAQEPMADYEHAEYAQSVSRLRSLLAEAEFNTLWAEGRSMTIDQAFSTDILSCNDIVDGINRGFDRCHAYFLERRDQCLAELSKQVC